MLTHVIGTIKLVPQPYWPPCICYEKLVSKKFKFGQKFDCLKVSPRLSKKKGKSSHENDVEMLREIALGRSTEGRYVDGEELKMDRNDILQSAFAVAGMNFGIPLAIVVE